MARRPTPTALRVARGARGAQREADAQPKADLLDPNVVPIWLPAKAHRWWPEVTRVLVNARIATVLDVALVARYATAFGEWCEAQQMVAEHGPIIKGRGGWPVRNPACLLAAQAGDRMKAYEVELGLTPSARAKLKPERDPESDQWEQFKRRLPQRKE